ncbi:MAG TPA: hypothetical protein VN947_09345 [Polyangia bacterium]|nr:hypothetical protein [Polyangia bacterium]
MRIRLLVLAAALGGCSSSPPAEVPAGCNPVIGDDCATPFPSSFFEVADAASPTGVRVAVAANVWPVTATNIPFRGDQLEGRDGFSPATPFIVYFKAGVDPSNLPTDADLTAALNEHATIQIINLADGSRVPLMAELDAAADPSLGDRQALIIRPMARLDNSAHYAIVILGLRDPMGDDLTPPGFRALRDKGALSKSLEPLQSNYEQLFTALAAAGVPRDRNLTLAWDVHTASDASVTGHLYGMVATSLAWLDDGGGHYDITAVNDTPSDPNLWREIVGTFHVPSFLTDDGPTATLNVDASGNPTVRDTGSAPFVVHIPQCALTATAPLPVIVFGHGLFGTAQNELSSDYQKQLAQTLCMIQIGTDWIGLAQYDFSTVASSVLGDLNQFPIVSDRLQQAHVNAQTLVRLFLTQMKDDPMLQAGGHAITDGSQIYYYGISDGGIQGGTFMALSRDVIRGVLNVPGSVWNLMMMRSHDFASLKTFLNSVYPDFLDQQVLIAALQSYWDYTDPISFAPHVIDAPFPSTPPKQILAQESINDAEVPNLATRILVRALGIHGMDLEQPVYGVDVAAAPLDSAYTQWDVHPMPVPPDVNLPPPDDNEAHGAIRMLPLLVKQIQLFFTPTGQVQQTCSDTCVF